MVTKLFVARAAAVILFGLLTVATAQHRYPGYGYGYGQHSHPYYQQQRPGFGGYNGFNGYPQQNGYQQQLPPGVSVQEAEWVCKNPKTGDMLIISSEDIPSIGTGQPQQPNNPQPTTFPQRNTQPTFAPPPPSNPTQSPLQPSTDAPNTNGEGVIDIRSFE